MMARCSGVTCARHSFPMEIEFQVPLLPSRYVYVPKGANCTGFQACRSAYWSQGEKQKPLTSRAFGKRSCWPSGCRRRAGGEVCQRVVDRSGGLQSWHAVSCRAASCTGLAALAERGKGRCVCEGYCGRCCRAAGPGKPSHRID